MGIFDRMKSKVEGLLDDGGADAGKHEWPADQPWARLVESEHRPGESTNSSADGGVFVDVAIDAVRGIPYRFVLEVHRPDVEVYNVSQESRVPSKVERTLMQGSQYVQKGTEVPLTITGPTPADVEIDWEGYLRRPGRCEESQRLGGENQLDQLGAMFEKNTKPAQVEKIRANSRFAAMSLADMVVAGQVSRADFEQNLEPMRRMGHLAQADYDEAVARIEVTR